MSLRETLRWILFEGALLFDATTTEDLEQLAFFGEVSFDLTEQLTAVAGVRHYDYDQKVTDTLTVCSMAGLHKAAGK